MREHFTLSSLSKLSKPFIYLCFKQNKNCPFGQFGQFCVNLNFVLGFGLCFAIIPEKIKPCMMGLSGF